MVAARRAGLVILRQTFVLRCHGGDNCPTDTTALSAAPEEKKHRLDLRPAGGAALQNCYDRHDRYDQTEGLPWSRRS